MRACGTDGPPKDFELMQNDAGTSRGMCMTWDTGCERKGEAMYTSSTPSDACRACCERGLSWLTAC